MTRGSSLIEVLVYLACSVLLCSLVGQLMLGLRQAAYERSQALDEWVELAIALNQLLDDLKYAPKDLSLWKRAARNEVIFPLRHTDCGWCIDRKRLVRVTGKHFFNGWSGRATSVVMESAQKLNFKFEKKQSGKEFVGVAVTLEMKGARGQTKRLEGFTSLGRL